MVRRLWWVAFIFLMAMGCAKPKSLAGSWVGKDKDVGSVWAFGEDGTVAMFAANDFAAGGAEGKYELTSDKLTLLGFSGVAKLSFKYEWVGADQISLTADIDPSQSFHLTRTGPAMKTVSLAGMAKAGGAQFGVETETKTQLVTCLSNLKEIGLGMSMYAQDWDENLPESSHWEQEIMPYIKNEKVFTCPVVAKESKTGGYAMSAALSGVSMRAVKTPEAQVLGFESEPGVTSGDSSQDLISKPRHDKVAYLYADAHVKAR